MTLDGHGKRLFINEVAPRDGFQAEAQLIPTEEKIAFIDQLSRTGVAKIEATSFTSPKAIPALADAEQVMRGIVRAPGVVYVALVPNARGAERALSCGVDEMNLVMSASETHNLANLRMTREQSFAQLQSAVTVVQGTSMALNLSLSCTFGCPMEGDVPQHHVLGWIERAAAIGVSGITLCDTTGMAWPGQVATLCTAVRDAFPHLAVTAHFHDTRGMALVNVIAALEAGIVRFDASLGGLGGCPYAPGASGNVCTEDMVHMLELMNYATGVDLPALVETSRRLPALVGHKTAGQIVKAGRTRDLHPVPAYVATARERAHRACA